MPSDYERICLDNIREYGEGIRHLEFLGTLYADRTHFIYELLQNAEDASDPKDVNDPERVSNAKVFFDLLPNELRVWHTGRPFTERDVRGICGVGAGTKATDWTKIGKFGIGFKSVYAYTSSPMIISGDEAFRIEHYVRPCKLDAEKLEIQPPWTDWTTLMRFPFNRDGISAAQAVHDISNGLSSFGSHALLFLRNIREVSWSAPGQASIIYRRSKIKQGNAWIIEIKITSINGRRSDRWMLFEQPVELQPGNLVQHRVEVAFALKQNKDHVPDEIEPIAGAKLVVFFPTDKPTNLGFLIQGPYQTTPARDNIPVDSAINKVLVQATANLVVEAMEQLRDLNLLTVKALSTLPLRADRITIGSLFRPIYDAVRVAMRERPLLPVHGGGFSSAQGARLARTSELATLFTPEQLGALLGVNGKLQWLSSDITADKTPDLYAYLTGQNAPYLNDKEGTAPLIDQIQVRPETVVANLQQEFLRRQSDEWIGLLYEFFSQQRSLYASLKAKPIIRLEDGSHILPFKDGKPAVYLPSIAGFSTAYTIVKPTVANQPAAREFLKSLGITEPSTIDEIRDHILSLYPLGKRIAQYPGDAVYADHLDKIVRALSMANLVELQELRGELADRPFLRATSPDGRSTRLCVPKRIYLRTTDLELYFGDWTNDGFFLDFPPQVSPQVRSFDWVSLGVRNVLTCDEFDPMFEDNLLEELRNGARANYHEVIDYTMDGMPDFMEAIQNSSNREQRAQAFWRLLIAAYEACRSEHRPVYFKGKYRWSYRSNKWNGPVYFDACFTRQLQEYPWLPDRTTLGVLRKPEELTIDRLPPEFALHQPLLNALGISPDPLKELAKEAGISVDDLRLVQSNPKEFEEWKRSIQWVKPEGGGQSSQVFDFVDALAQAFSKEQHGDGDLSDDGKGDDRTRDPSGYRDRTKAEIEAGKNQPPRTRFRKVDRKVWEAKDSQVREFLA